ncbi:MAG: Uma2 family endonuclease [Thiomargarita sp.]|nr:Uma2 family endonuclease [Thiomargarita sp.]
MTTLHVLNRSSTQKYYSPPRKKVSEVEYWKKYYNNPIVVYEWNNGYLEEKAVSDFLTISMYKWFFELLEHYLRTNPIAQSVLLEMGFRLTLSGKKEVRRPDLAVVLNENPVPLLPDDKTYQGTFDLCVEVLSDSTEEIRKRDTITKKKEYAMCGVKEYYILDGRRERTQFYHLSSQGVYIPIIPIRDIIKSTVLPGFQFRIEDLFTKPTPDEMISDKVYQRFVLPGYAEEKRARQEEKRAHQAEKRARQAEKRARKKAEERTERLAQKLRALGIDPDKI